VKTGPTAQMSPAYYELIRPFGLRAKLALGAEILSAYVRVRMLLYRHDLQTAVGLLRRDGPESPESPDDRRGQAIGVRLGKAVERTLRLVPFDSRCLVRSLVLTGMLARRGIESRVVIGVTVDPTFSAHAWVESDGIALLPPLEAYDGRLIEI
jgi:transglutaminase superfamily protein